MNKKWLCLFIILFSLFFASSCTKKSKKEYDFRIVTIDYSVYDWTMNILGEKNKDFDVTYLLDNGVDIHSYQPSINDIKAISSSDLFIYIGGESESWIEDLSIKNKLCLFDFLENIKDEEIVDGMKDEETDIDEHIWMSLKNAIIFVSVIENKICEIDALNKERYKENSEAYIQKLENLDNEYTSSIENSAKDTILVGDRFPFRYLVDDYNLNYYAAFLGCSSETEASFNTIISLAKKIDELNLSTILITESSNGRIAETIKENTRDKNQNILVLNSLQSATSKDYKKGKTYLSIMVENLEILKEALK
ncbi:zinc ABC transporter substrate-binding protein [bacterium]|nr:zinc ABC transporter substrate-binding protein [bacterium]